MDKSKLSSRQAQDKKGCLGCLAILAIIVVVIVLIYSRSTDECVQLNGKWYCGPKDDVQNINRMDNANQKKVGREVDAREAQENANK